MLRCLVFAFLAGCTSVGHRAAESLPPAMIWATVRFESPRELQFVPRQFVLASSHEAITGVLELGGQVIVTSDDSLVLHPSYVIVQGTMRQDRPRTLWRGGKDGLPLLAIVRPTPDMYLGAYRPPRPKMSYIDEALIVGPGLILFVSMMYGFFTHHW